MAGTGQTIPQRNRKIRQDALREQLAAGGHLQHVIDMVGKLADLNDEIDQITITRLRAAIDAKLKLVGKYLPDLKAVEVTGEDGGPISISTVRREIVDANADNSNS